MSNRLREPASSLPVGACCTEMATHEMSRLFKALSDPGRIVLLSRLADCGRACTVSEISCCLPVDLSVASRHLAQLREAGILHAEKRGKEVFYEVRRSELITTLRRIADALEASSPESCCKPPPRDAR
ncbi:MAG TPA: metalloregulator ArsR/SmtB family transcription factor [Phycisphaerales bacterium]|nr:metalloregulator ArsR/SmtB family transcription factor [Phycisphaerales bacterium]HRQ74923.1 metalloregulator ArsR/SmtB family transcription factor [Phycisphaerales bacterium]